MQSKSLPQAVKQHFFTVGEAKGMTKQPYTAAGESVKPCFCKPERHVSLRGNAESNIVQNGAASSSVGSSSSRKTCIPNGPLCFHCRRMTCSECWRHCMHCEENFCSVCSILDFNERYDRAFCLDCYSVVQRTNSK
ncbi:hypothetical protein KP509_32G056400 [Ceratopteris richardii]|nr:hypothetical protein KP509_32G056400 [Ceratopteris richardii]